jgi:TolB-like protein/DNA-binding winged helix-turn-helix (wHTH) protein/tetratricopeptide (TPR) repeat protein
VSGSTATEVFAFSGFSLDARQRVLFGPDGQPVPLSARAFDTLLFLTEHPNQLIDKQTLMKAVWPNVIVEENNLNQNISLVRRALGETPGEHRFVVTVPGRGFRFVSPVTRLDSVPRPEPPVEPNGTARAPESPESTPAIALARVDPKKAKAWVPWVSGIAAAAALVVLALYFFVYHFRANREASLPASARSDSVVVGMPSLAVLPFVNMSADKDQEYFSDGLSEELMNQLAQLPGLRVTGRTSSFAFKGHYEDLRTIGRKLGVTNVLEGSVRKSGTHLRITVQLVKCSDGSYVWSDAYDREFTDVFTIQEGIAGAVAKVLSVKLGVGTQAPDYGGTSSFEAYDQFLKAHPGSLFDADGFSSHAEHLRRAVAIDPNYALAWADLATLLTYRQQFLSVADAQRLDAERAEATRRALDLAPDLPEANVAEGWHQADKKNWLAAAAAHRRAIARGPGHDPAAENIVGGFLTATGRVREALPFRERARDADPLSLDASSSLMGSYFSLGMWQRYDAEYKRSQDLEGDRGLIEVTQLFRLMATHAGPAAMNAQFDRMQRGPNALELFQALAKVHTSRDQARVVLRQHLDIPVRLLYGLAQLAGAYGDNDLALEALRKAASSFGAAAFQTFWYPTLSEVRKDPRFKDLMRENGLAEFWRVSDKWPDFCHPLGTDDFECQ